MLCADVEGDTLCTDGTLVNSENGITFCVLTAARETQHSLEIQEYVPPKLPTEVLSS